MFESAKLKVKRANHHIQDAERQLEIFTGPDLHGMAIQLNADKTIRTLTFGAGNELSNDFALAIGDAIHNLRSALDHLTWEIVGRDGGTQDRDLSFPISKYRTNFETACDALKTPSLATKTMFKSFEAFSGGKGHFLYVLSKIDNSDKHRIVTPIVKVSEIKKLFVRNERGELIKSFVANISMADGETLSLDGMPDGSTIDFDNDSEIATEILFGNVDSVGHEPIIPTLAQMMDAVLDTIQIVEDSII